MRAPVSTYRLQLNSGFPFTEAERLVPYLKDLGIDVIYCSPILTAKSGSVHCYDVTDHSRVNPELGGVRGFEHLSSRAKKAGMGLLLDIVPNHMSTSSENASWMDVLEHGPGSSSSAKFDIDWHPQSRGLSGKVLLPVLPVPLREAVASGLVGLAVGDGEKRISLTVGGRTLPLAPETVEEAFECLADARPRARAGVAPRRLLSLLSKQHYVLAKWTEADTRINYRRFLNVNELVAVRVEDHKVFAETHRVVASLLRSGEALGIRVDHADGLRDPTKYFRWLRRASGDSYVVAEKIMIARRALPPEWDVDGTTGYEFLNEVNRVLVKGENEGALDRVYRRFTGSTESFASDVREGKLLAMETMRAESRRLARLLCDAFPSRASVGDAERAVTAMAANFRGYRTYITPRNRWPGPRTRAAIMAAAKAATKEGVPRGALRTVRDALLLVKRDGIPKARRASALDFVLRFQQFTAAVAVKGEEDTALYRYVRLTSLNEVGGDPSRFGETVAEFHRGCGDRGRRSPRSINTSSTHDTKRSEDVRARIDVISEIPEEWGRAIGRWHRIAAPLVRRVGGRDAPSRRDEYLFYQTVVGTLPGSRSGARYVERVSDYMLKAIREERQDTSWGAPDVRYEAGVMSFVAGALRRGSLSRDLESFGRVVGWYGALNSLTQTLLKVTAPGIPDVYQGNEMMDFSLVDPDNRRPVDFGLRKEMLGKLDSLLASGGEAAASRAAAKGLMSGVAKLYVTAMALRARRAARELFAGGRYIPVRSEGEKSGNVVAFVRRSGTAEFVVCAPRLFTELCGPGDLPCGRRSWGDTRLVLPARGLRTYVDVFTGRRLSPETTDKTRSLKMADISAAFPVALLRSV